MGPVPYLELFWAGPVKKVTLYIDDDGDDDDSHQVGLPSTGITVFGSQLHTHGTGRKVGRHLIDHHCCVDGDKIISISMLINDTAFVYSV